MWTMCTQVDTDELPKLTSSDTTRDPWQATGLLVLTVRGNRIAAVTRFEPDGRFAQHLDTGLKTRDNTSDMSAR